MGNSLPSSFESLADQPGWPFVGRVAQVKAARQLVMRAKSGTGAVALIDGEPGMGKSRFLYEIAARESEAAVMIPLVCSAAVVDEGRPLREQLTAALRGRDLLGVARQRPVLCTIDDVHNATTDDRAVIETLASAAAAHRVVVLAACASEWSGAWTRGNVVSMNLAPLDRSRSEVLLKAMLSVSGESADAQTVATILRIAAGSPRYLHELVARLSDFRAGNASLIPQSAEAQVVMLRRELGRSNFEVLREASVFGAEFREEWLTRLAQRSNDEVIAALQDGVDSGLIRELTNRRATFVFRDEGVRSALYETLVTARRRTLHRRIASQLCGDDSGDEVNALAARHWAEAGEAGRAVDALLSAAARSAKRLDFGDAQELARTAAALSERDSVAWWNAQELMADFAAATGEFRGASRLRRRLAQHYRAMGRDDDAFDQLFSLMHDYWYDGRPTMADAIYGKLQKFADQMQGSRPAQVEIGYAELCGAAGRRTEALRILAQLPAEALATQTLAIQYRRQLASMGSRDRPIADTLAMFEESCALAHAAGDHSDEYYTAFAGAAAAAELGLVSLGRDWLARAGQVLFAHADAAVGTARFMPLQMCELLLLQGRFEEARDAIAEAGLGKRLGGYFEALLSGFGVFIGMRLGDASLIAPYFNNMHLHRAIRAGQAEATGVLLWGYAEFMQSQGMHEELAAALRRCTENELIDPYFSIQLHCARFGSDDDVRTARKQLDVEVSRESNVVARACSKLFDAFAAARQNRGRAAASAARAAAAAFRELEWPWLEALALETAGDRAEAMSLYTACGAVRDAGRAAGLSRKERRAAFGASLTPRELEIRTLVPLGLTNREIANRLGVTERTVGHHLESIYSKCGVRARWQLGPESTVTAENAPG
jgi:DNA-binding CsgD family transcriptional regulator